MTTCAAPGCDNPVPRTHRRGRPAIYCTPDCRPSRQPGAGNNTLTVDMIAEQQTGRGRNWTATLRRGRHAVIIGQDLGHFAATLLAQQLRQLLHPRQQGGHG